MLKLHTLCSTLLVIAISLTSALAQSDVAKSDINSAVVVTASSSGERVRFTAPSSVVQIRLEVYDSAGKRLFDNELRGGNVLDWRLQDGQAERLADGTYLCVVTVKALSGKLTQKLGSVVVEATVGRLQAISAEQLTAQQAQAAGPVEQDSALTILREDEPHSGTVLAYSGEEGQIARSSGALSFRLGDFFSGKDQEQMRLTAEGKLGIGVTDPQAKLDVAGLIRTSEGIVFPDGSVQTTAYVASGRTLCERAGLQRDMQDRRLDNRLEDGSRAAPTGPQATLASAGRLSKFVDAAGNLADSGVLETFAGGGLVQTFGNTPATGGAFNHVVEIVAASGKTPLTLVGGAGAMEFWKDNTPTSAIAFGVAKPATPAVATDDMIFSTYAAGNGWFERMRLTNDGNVGIGTSSPRARLEVQTSWVTGVYGHSTADIGTGVEGRADSTYPNGTHAKGVAGYSNLGTGVYGDGNNNGIGVYGRSVYFWAGFFDGRVGVNGNLAIGTSTPDSRYKLYVDGGSDSAGVFGGSNLNNGVGINGFSGASNGIGVSGYSESGIGVYGYSPSGIGVEASSHGSTRNFAALRADNNNPDRGMAAYLTNSSNYATAHFANAGTGEVLYLQNGGGDFIKAVNSTETDSKFRVLATGEVRSDVGFNTPAADFAEMLPASDGLEAGDVLVIGKDGKLTLSSRPRQTSVAGVYSTKPGFVGGKPVNGERENEIPLAVVGIVPVKVTAENGPIRPGDLLTTSSTPGHAMKAGARTAMGTVIGKALGTLQSGTGVIQMLAILQ